MKTAIERKAYPIHEKCAVKITKHGRGPANDYGRRFRYDAQGVLPQCNIKERALLMFMRLTLAFIFHRGTMSCAAASCSIGSQPVHRGEVTRETRWLTT
jgi:hypothetical protein